MAGMAVTDPVHWGRAAAWGGWSWKDPARGEHYRTCSYCGGIHPTDLAAEPPGWRAEWADQKYGWPHKFYVHITNREPERLFAIGASSHIQDHPEPTGSFFWVATADMTDEQKTIAERDGMPGSDWAEIMFGTRTEHHAKFYTAHLADPGIPEADKQVIQRTGGLWFVWNDAGGVQWHNHPPAEAATATE